MIESEFDGDSGVHFQSHELNVLVKRTDYYITNADKYLLL